MGTTLVILLLAAAIVAGVILLRRRRAQAGPGEPRASKAPGRRLAGGQEAAGVRTLAPGDVVLWDGADFIVEGTVRFEQGGFQWAEHRLVAGERAMWLSVEDDEGLEVVVWQRAPSDSGLEPGAKKVTVDGVAYALDEGGTAHFTALGSTGTGPGGTVAYFDYEAGDRRLSFERFGDGASWEVSTGEIVSEHALDIYPGRGLEP